MHKTTSNQPELVKQRIYGSQPVHPIEGASNQPEVLPHTKVHGQRTTATVIVKLTDSGAEAVINESDFNPAKHERMA